MSDLFFTRDQARTMLLAAQGFGDAPKDAITQLDVRECVRRMGVLQIDTIHIVARSPYLVLWSRLGGYDPALLEHLLRDGEVFEYWSHEACFIPIEDYPYYRRFMLESRKHTSRFEWLNLNREAADQMLQHVRDNGETRSSDFERTDGKRGNWWDWKHEKKALDFLHTAGELMISRRDKFHRIYDLRERVLPDWQDSSAPSYEDVMKKLVQKTVGCLGVAASGWCADYFRLPKKEVVAHLAQLTAEGLLHQATIEGIEMPAFVTTESLGLVSQILSGQIKIYGATLLSPFDPVVWDRKRALELFAFDYRIECYVPEPKRKFGYFVLPILVGNRLVGRLDAKAHRKDKVLEIKAIFLEAGVEATPDLVEEIGAAIRRFASWHHSPTVKVSQADRPKLAKQIEAAAKPVRRSRKPALTG